VILALILAHSCSATIGTVSVFKRLPGTHMHIRTPVTLGLVVLLVIVLSAFCYYGGIAPDGPVGLQLASPIEPLWR